MGCCESTPAAPEVIIPDPGEQEECTFSIKSAGMMSSDYLAYQGDSTDDKEKKWQFINKTGSLWSGDAVIEIENFVRGGNPEKPNQGEISWRCNFDSSPEFQKHHKSPSSGFSRYVASFTNGAVDFDGEEPGDEVYFERAGSGFNDGGNRRVMKWSLETSASITPGGARGAQYGAEGFLLRVFARGTSICDYDWEHDEEGGGHWSRREKEFVDQLCFQVVQRSTDTVIAMWAVPGDLQTGGELVSMTNALFAMQLRGGWFSTKPLVNTAAGWDPLFALLVAHLCAFEYSPNAIKKDLNSDFPDDPHGWPGY